MNTWPRVTSQGMLAIAGTFFALGCTEPIVRAPAGLYEATTYVVSPSAGQSIDMLVFGATWTLDISEDGTVVSTTDVAHEDLVSHDVRTGTATLDGGTVWFWGFGNDRILTGRRWTLDGDLIVSEDQTVNGVNGTIRFTRRSGQ